MEIRLLGELEVVGDDGSALAVRGAKQRALLALLALHRGESVGAERIIDSLWGDDLPGNPSNALQALVANLRRALGATAVVTTDTGYALSVVPDDVDIVRFERLASEGRHYLEAGDSARAADALAGASGLLRGEPLVEFAFAEFAQGERVRLTELALNATEARVEADLASGEHAQLIGELEALCADHPLRERFWELRMLALYRAGRQAEALRVYTDARDRLIDELGLEPGPALRDLERQVLTQDPSLDAPYDRRRAAPAALTGNLRDRLTSFVGRVDEVARFTDALATHRLVTLIGPGGSGKTRLAVEVAARLQETSRDGAWFVELASVLDPDGVTPAVFAALEAGQSVAVDGAAGSTLDQLVAHLEDRSLIIVLDNCEHVIGAAATLVETLVERVPALQMIATSREALGVPGEVLLPVGPLPIEDAVKVFTDRAEAVRLDFVTDESNRSMVEDVCRRLDGMPLALELAAARMRSLPLGQLVDRLDDRFRVLTGGARTALPRQQTLRAVVDWSYDLLFEDERRLFARLSVFAGGCTLEAAEHVCGDEIVSDDQVCDLLLRLVDKSLVLAELDGADARYTQLQTLWQYARERLAESSEADEFRQSHARWFLDMARRARPLLRGRTAVEWRARIFADWDNVRSAFDWFAEAGDAQSAFSLVDGVAWSWFARNDPHEAVRWLDDALAVRGPSTPELRSMVVAWHAYFNAQILGPENERTELLEALDVLRAGSDQRRLADALMIAAELCNRSQQGAESQGFADEARVVLVELGDEWGLAICDSLTARNHSLAGRLDESVEFATASIDRLKAIGEESLIFEGLGQLAILLEVRGDLDAAAAAYADLKAESHTRGLPLYEIQWTVRLAALRSRQGDDAGAEALFTEFLAIDSIPAGKAWALMGRGGAVRRQGDLARARRDLDEALDVYEALGLPAGYALALSALSWWAIDAGDLEAAATFAERARSSATEQPDELVRLVVDTAGVAAALVRADSAATRSTFTALLADRARIGTGRYIALIGGPIGAYLDEPDVAALTKGLGLALV